MKKFLSLLVLPFLLLSCAEDEPEVFGSIYGTVKNAETGSVVYNAEITLSPGHTSPITGSNGNYEFSNLEARQYTLTVRAAGYIDDSRQVTVVPGESTRCDVLLTPEHEIEGVSLSTKMLDFGTSLSHLSLNIINTGNTPVNWHISTKSSVAWLEISPMSGVTEAGKSSDVTVSVNRSLMTDDSSAIFIVNAAGGSKSVTVYASKGNGNNPAGSDENTPGGGNNSGSGNSGPQDVTNGLYAYYMFEGNTNNAVDGAPNGQGINAPTYEAGMKGSKGLKLSVANNSYLSVPKAMIDGQTFSVSFWIKGLSDGHLFHITTSSSYNYGFDQVCAVRNSQLLMCSGYEWTHRQSSLKTFAHPVVNQNEWNMVTITSQYQNSSGCEVKLYINGSFVDVAQMDFSENPKYNYGLKFIFGGELKGITPPSMTIDNLRVYNSRVLSEDEVMQIYKYER